MSSSLLSALAEPPRSGSLHLWADGAHRRIPWSELSRGAEQRAAALRALGVGRGTAVACVLTNTRATVEGVLAVWLAGGTVLSLPAPARAMTLARYGRQLNDLYGYANAQLLCVDGPVAEGLRGVLDDDVRIVAWETASGSRAGDVEPPDPEAIAFVQFSSGSTSRPKGCALTTRAIEAQLQILYDMADVQPGEDEVVASWLPLSHDMGMFGCLLFSWAAGFDLVLSTPERFVHSPRSWLDDCARFGATLSATPSAGLHIATRAAGTRLPGPLRLRSCVLGGERVDWQTVVRALETFAPCGLRPESLMPAYGLAEATLAVTAIGPSEAPAVLTLDAAALADGEVIVRESGAPGSVDFVSCGHPCRGVDVRIDGDELGRLDLSSPSLADGYLADPQLTKERFRDGRYLSDDLGLLHDGAVYVVGRLDDILCVGGRKLYAPEIESVIDTLPGMRAGCSTLIELSEERVGLLLEARAEGADAGSLARSAARVVARHASVRVDDCYVLPPGTMPKTPSGKVQRFRCRQLVLSGDGTGEHVRLR